MQRRGYQVAEEGVSSCKKNFLSACRADFSGVKFPRITRITRIVSNTRKKRGSFFVCYNRTEKERAARDSKKLTKMKTLFFHGLLTGKTNRTGATMETFGTAKD